jgi:hypothetical protein
MLVESGDVLKKRQNLSSLIAPVREPSPEEGARHGALVVVRITATGVLHVTAGSHVARLVYHDLAGWLMMGLALGLLWLELKFIDHLFVTAEDQGPLALGLTADPVEHRPTRGEVTVSPTSDM